MHFGGSGSNINFLGTSLATPLAIASGVQHWQCYPIGGGHPAFVAMRPSPRWLHGGDVVLVLAAFHASPCSSLILQSSP